MENENDEYDDLQIIKKLTGKDICDICHKVLSDKYSKYIYLEYGICDECFKEIMVKFNDEK